MLLPACAADNLPTTANGPANATVAVPSGPSLGALVQRFRDTGFEISWDPTRNVTWTLGLISPLSELCDPNPDLDVDESGSFQSVTTPNGVRHIQSITGGRVTLVLYEGIPPSNICNGTVLGHGYATSTTNDNDQFLSGTGTNSFGRRVSGIVELADGTRAHLLIVSRMLIHPDQFDDDPLIPITVVDRFELTPIGPQ
jgi:hypothetical protein